MSITDPVPGASSDPSDLPTFELSCAVDDAEDPRRVTVFGGPATPDELDEVPVEFVRRWISIDAAHAVPLEDVA